MNKLFKLLPLLATGLAVTSCQDEDFGYTASEIREHANFVEVFGEPDPNHTWSTAAYRYVNVNLQLPDYYDEYQCRIWTADPSRTKQNLYYMADLMVENGEVAKIGIDCPETLQTVYISLTDADGGTIVMPANFDKEGNASVTFGNPATRATIASTSTGINVFYYSKAADANNTDWENALAAATNNASDGWGYFPKSKYDAVISVFPENGGNAENPPCESFVFQSEGKDLVVYPFYGVSGNVTNNKIVYWVYNPADGKSYQEIVAEDPSVLMPANSMIAESRKGNSFANYTSINYWNETVFTNVDTRTRPYILSGVPAGWRVIFACTRDNGEGYFYSVKELNVSEKDHVKASNAGDIYYELGQTYSMAGTATIGSDTYMAFEDTWYTGQYDCQDMIFAVYGAKAVDLNTGGGEAMGFVVAYEDLGSTLDMDYNDIVIRVEHVTATTGENTEKDCNITLLAAGGTMPVVPLYRKNDSSPYEAIFAGRGADTGNTGEAHAVFGFDSNIPVNAGPATKSAAPVSSTIKVNRLNPVSDVAKNIIMSLTSTDNMVFTKNIAFGANGTDRTDNVPYAILIANPKWEWPTENTLISDVYPAFKTWVGQHSTQQEWYGVQWDGGTAADNNHIGIIAANTYHESSSIANINPAFLNDYLRDGTTLYFVFDGYSANSDFTIKSQNGDVTKTGTIGADGNASIVLSAADFSSIYYKEEDVKADYYVITAFANKYGVSFGTTASFEQSDINGTNSYAELTEKDGTKIVLGSHNNLPSITKEVLAQYETIEMTIKATNFKPGSAITEYENSYNNIITLCNNDGMLNDAKISAVYGRTGIYRITISNTDFASMLSNSNSTGGILFKDIEGLEVAIKGLRSAGLAASNLTLGCNKSNIDLVANGTITSNSNGAITITTESDKVTINGTSISTREVDAATNVTLTIDQDAAEGYAAAQTTMTLTIDPDAKDVNDLTVTTLGRMTMNAKETKSLSECTTAPVYSGSGTGAISYSSSNTDVITVDASTGAVTAKNVAEESTAYVLISQAEDDTYAVSGALQYIEVTVIPAAKENVNGKTKTIDLDYVGPNDWNSGHWYKADLSSFTVNSGTTVTDVKLNNLTVDKYCYNKNWGGQTNQTNWDESFVAGMFDEGYLYIHVYNKASVTPTISITFSE